MSRSPLNECRRLLGLRLSRPLPAQEQAKIFALSLKVLDQYRRLATNGNLTKDVVKCTKLAFYHLGGATRRSSQSLKDYNHKLYGPFLGVSDEGSAANAVRTAAYSSPKACALRASHISPLSIGVAVDAERLGGIGEVAVGPEEYADVWLGCVERLLMTTNIGSRVNFRTYKREPRIVLKSGGFQAITNAENQIAAAFKPFVETPDKNPRPLCVLVDIPRYVKMSTKAKVQVLRHLRKFVASGKAAAKSAAPKGQTLGLAAWVARGKKGQKTAFEAIDLAAKAGIKTVVLDGVKRKEADEAISFAGLLDYFAPGIVGPLLRKASECDIDLRSANVADPDTIARGVWAGLSTARNMGMHLGKYGCFPLTLSDTEDVVMKVNKWFRDWSAAPVFYIDHGLLRDIAVDVENDLPRGIEAWLRVVSKNGVRIVLIDTINKASGRRLIKKHVGDKQGYLGLRQIQRIEKFARKERIKVLWAGGLAIDDVFALGQLGVFGIYVTSSAAVSIPVAGAYVRDPALAALKEPTKEGVLRTKILLEAGFLSVRQRDPVGNEIAKTAIAVLEKIKNGKPRESKILMASLKSHCVRGWREFWKNNPAMKSSS